MTCRVSLLASTLLLVACLANAADWTHWRGPEQNGVSRDTGLPDQWSPDKPGEGNLIWKQPYGGRSAPLISKGKVYIINGSGRRANEQERVMCFDAKTGKLEWEYKFNIFLTDIVTNRVGWANLAADPETGNVYAHGVQGLFFCFSPDGKVLWSKSLTEEYGRITGYGGRVTTPIVDEDLVIIHFLNASWGNHGRGGHRFLALDKRTGEPIWWSEPGGRPLDTIYSVPVVAVINGQRLLICGGADGSIHAMKVRTGEKVWSYPLSKRGINCSPVVSGDYVYITQAEENLEPNTPNGAVFCLDASKIADGKPMLVWRETNIRAGDASPIIHDGRLYVPENSARLYCLDAKTGKELWEHTYGTVAKGSPILADGKIYAPEVTSKFVILKPEDQECKTIHTVEFPPGPRGEVMEINGSPSVADGRVYIITGDALYCIGTGSGSGGDIPPPVKEDPPKPDAKPAHLQVVPAEVVLEKGGMHTFKARLFDAQGRFLRETRAEWSLPQPPQPPGQPPPPRPPALKGNIDENGKLTVDDTLPAQAGYVVAKAEGLTSSFARVRVVPSLPIIQDFENVPEGAVPAGWVNASGKFVVTHLKEGDTDSKVLKKLANNPNPLLARAYAYIGPPQMSNYTIEADVMGREVRGNFPNMGVLNSRYSFWVDGNAGKLMLTSWEANHRFERDMDFEPKENAWYRLKFEVRVLNGEAHCRGKIWLRTDEEPEKWTIEAVDKTPNTNGSPGLYAYAQSILEDDDGKILPGTEVFYDNVKVTPNK